ncbi:Transcription initiation factor TFIID subunit 3 [Echinococcus multilocularis]|uniref:Transcription initiation factor TFIID subunit 3 n=1 Tax=Echinococcus multilocularis TaxID=6211 RepID=A0A068Y4D4_ECHMU|nr:Transcription initiation factor TFIID subunit 3 [Echinococcus multilocularis]
MADKRLVLGYVKQSAVHNRILEEDRCWREYKNRQRDRAKQYRRPSSQSPPLLLLSRSDSAERKWRRERKRKLEENSQITASAAAPTTALDFWRQVVRCSGSNEGRWGHDGFKELEKPGPPASLSVDMRFHLHSNLSSQKLPSFAPNVPPSPDKTWVSYSSSTSSSLVSERVHNKRKKKSKKAKKKRTKKTKRETRKRKLDYNSSTRSPLCFSNDSSQDVEWVEKKT